MTNMYENNSVKRRRFLKGVLSAAAVFCLGKTGLSETFFEDDFLSKSLFVNPAYKNYLTSTGDLILETKLKGGERRFIQCRGLEKDVLQIIMGKNCVLDSAAQLSEKYGITKNKFLSISASFVEYLCKEGFLIDKNSKINVVENVIKDPQNK